MVCLWRLGAIPIWNTSRSLVGLTPADEEGQVWTPFVLFWYEPLQQIIQEPQTPFGGLQMFGVHFQQPTFP